MAAIHQSQHSELDLEQQRSSFAETSTTLMNSTPSAPIISSNEPARTQILSKKSMFYLPFSSRSLLKSLWSRLGFNKYTVTMMIKGALAPTISTAIYQRPSVAANYVNLGYLMIVISILSVPILPRGKFLMNLLVSLCLTCFAAAMVLLGQWAGIKARQNTIGHVSGYSSSASAVNAIFLIVNVFAINVLRAARPAFSIPSIGYTVFVIVGFVYGPQEPTEYASKRFTKELLYSFLTGQAIAAGVSLLIIPVSSRKVFFAEATGFLQTTRKLLKEQLTVVEVLQHWDTDSTYMNGNKSGPEPQQKLYVARANTLRAVYNGLLGLGEKLQVDVVFAKREIAYGHLGTRSVEVLHRHLRMIMMPVSSLSTISDIAKRLSQQETLRPPSKVMSHEVSEKSDRDMKEEWEELIREFQKSFEMIVPVLDEALLHVLILLKLVPGKSQAAGKSAPRSTPVHGDIEMAREASMPGDLGFGNYLDRSIIEFRNSTTSWLQTWASEKGLSCVLEASAKHIYEDSSYDGFESKMHHNPREVKQLHLIIYMEYLLYNVSKAVLDLVNWVESKVSDGSMERQRLIFPPGKILMAWLQGLFTGKDSNPSIDDPVNADPVVTLGDSLKLPKDAEHLPPKNSWQVFGDHVRKIPEFLGSDPCKFGARVTIGVMSIGIMAYLQNSHAFFIRQRVIWGLVMISIGMNPTAGSSVFNLMGNLTATLVAMIFSYINWYAADQNTAGIIVLLFFFLMVYFYFVSKYPRFLVAIAAGAITHVLIVGYELQVRVLGIKQATATGQEYYPIYELAPFRLLVVGGGVLIGYFWTIFPVPITEGSVTRTNMGSSLFLLAKYLSTVTSTVDQRVRDQEGGTSLRSNPSRKLEEMRQKILAQEIGCLNAIRQSLTLIPWEPHLGGNFPKDLYMKIVVEVQSAVDYLTIIAYASYSFPEVHLEPSTSTWLKEFARSRKESDGKSHQIATLLVLLSASVKNNHPIPPFLKAPEKPFFLRQISGNDSDISALRNIDQPGFRPYVAIEVAYMGLISTADKLILHIKELVGEIDFSYTVDTHLPEGLE